RGALPGRKPGTATSWSVTSFLNCSCILASMAERSMVTLMCFLHGPMSLNSTCCGGLAGFSSVAAPVSAAGSAVAVPASGVVGTVLVSSVIGSSRKRQESRLAANCSRPLRGQPQLAAKREKAGDGARTHDSHVGNVALYH